VTNSPFQGISRDKALLQALVANHGRLLAHAAGPVIERAHSVDPGGAGSLDDIEHVVLLMQENRSFDHYFGTMSSVAGFSDTSEAFGQRGYQPGVGATPDGILMPFRLDTLHGATLDGAAINDPIHTWGAQHRSWNNGGMDNWVREHIAANGPANGPVTMGYYTAADIPVHRAIADAFTVCDHYFCSVLGPTDPNRLYWISATIDPDGDNGGPLLETTTAPPLNVYSWQTYPERLQDAGISWKLYSDRSIAILSRRFLSGMLGAFKAFNVLGSPLATNGLDPTYPADFRADVAAGTLPAVSWVVPSLLTCEHPALPSAFGAIGLIEILDILTSNPAVWEKTALIVSYDENGGFFDHLTPPTPASGEPGEYLTVPVAGVAESESIPGPIGLGFRVPCLVISPYSRGGLVCPDVFDHTSQLRLLERRFGVEVPNLSAWRRRTTGDLTSAFDFGNPPNDAPPNLPDPDAGALRELIESNIDIVLGTLDHGRPYPVPANSMPVQDTLPVRRRPTGPV
jgi:phospholipase C